MHLIERPPKLYRLLFPGAVWRRKGAGDSKAAYLTFDDGPIPEVTPWTLDVLDQYSAKATFFMVGDNVRRHPELADEVVRRGHSAGNHTMHHLQGIKSGLSEYLDDVGQAARLIPSRLFRPPHGLLRPSQLRALASEYTIVMYDLVSRDYSSHLTADDVFDNVRRYARDGSIIVFHDSLKAFPRLRDALPRAIEWLVSQGYDLRALPMA